MSVEQLVFARQKDPLTNPPFPRCCLGIFQVTAVPAVGVSNRLIAWNGTKNSTCFSLQIV
jgi:hypothetical protein